MATTSTTFRAPLPTISEKQMLAPPRPLYERIPSFGRSRSRSPSTGPQTREKSPYRATNLSMNTHHAFVGHDTLPEKMCLERIASVFSHPHDED
ncbi:uncharacterized protein SCHCODRAFT_02497214 [Schizophyllum commune H4-8]|nr:uncharacterized protein SCHCODRAFT_02497214 [Schizophyllum commune H4-8]KAI5895070.1 hypothetical protein SCHCODRAFT_02497214 [Schizophyllum commune H4-8]